MAMDMAEGASQGEDGCVCVTASVTYMYITFGIQLHFSTDRSPPDRESAATSGLAKPDGDIILYQSMASAEMGSQRDRGIHHLKPSDGCDPGNNPSTLRPPEPCKDEAEAATGVTPPLPVPVLAVRRGGVPSAISYPPGDRTDLSPAASDPGEPTLTGEPVRFSKRVLITATCV